MGEVSKTIDPNLKVNKYTFRFPLSDQVVHLTQHQLNLIPYLSTLLSHKNDFLSIENENGECILNDSIKYPWFLAILRSITCRNPFKLLDKLPSDENILDVLQLFDYLGVQSFSLPILRNQRLVRKKPDNDDYLIHSIEYHRATLSEARRTAAEFVLALANNQYKLNDSTTMKGVYNLINVILFNAEIFSFRFRHHTLTIAKKRCYSFFSENQRRQLESSYRLPQYKKINSDKFRNTFSWRGVYVSISDYITKVSLKVTNRVNMFSALFERDRLIWSNYNVSHGEFNRINIEIPFDHRSLFPFENMYLGHNLIAEQEIPLSSDDKEVSIDELQQDRRKEESQSARSGRFNTLYSQVKVDKFKHRSGRFNTLYSQVKVDKFKHRSGPKMKKYR